MGVAKPGGFLTSSTGAHDRSDVGWRDCPSTDDTWIVEKENPQLDSDLLGSYLHHSSVSSSFLPVDDGDRTYLLERALEACGDDLDSAIRSLNGLRLGSADQNPSSATTGVSDVAGEGNAQLQSQANGEVPVGEENPPKDGADWVELFVREMMSASDMDDAKARASRVLEVLEKSIYARASADAVQSFQQENIMLKEQVEALIQENTILKRAVSIQHERQKESEDRNQELQQLKQLVSQYQDQLRTLEVNNYALTLHLKQAQQSSSIPGRFHPDIF